MMKMKDTVERQEWYGGERCDHKGKDDEHLSFQRQMGLQMCTSLILKRSVMEPIISRNCICNTFAALTEPHSGHLTNYCQHMKSPCLKPLIWDPLPNHSFFSNYKIWAAYKNYIYLCRHIQRKTVHQVEVDFCEFSTTGAVRLVFLHMHVCAMAVNSRGMM